VIRVSAGEFQREFGRLRGVAHREAVVVTRDGRDDVVLLSVEEYQRLRSLDRSAMQVSELTDEEIAALDAVEPPAEATRYNHEMVYPSASSASNSTSEHRESPADACCHAATKPGSFIGMRVERCGSTAPEHSTGASAVIGG
jgi:prevent-host-death family protein